MNDDPTNERQPKEMLRSDFDALSARQKIEFIRAGGQPIDPAEPEKKRPALATNQMWRPDFDKLAPSSKLDFIRNGGTLTD